MISKIPSLAEIRIRLEEARLALDQAKPSPFVSKRRLTLKSLEKKLAALEKTPAGLPAARRKEMLGRKAALGHEVAEFETTIQSSESAGEVVVARDSLRRALRRFAEPLEAFIPLYHYINCMVDSKDRRLAVSGTGDVYSMSTEEIRHVYCIGGTGSGKSKLLESMMIQDILAGRGGCLIDPFGGLFKEVAGFCLFHEEIVAEIKRAQREFREFRSKHRHNLRPLRHDPLLKGLTRFAGLNLDKLLPPLNVKMIDLSEEANETSPNPHRINPFQLEKGERIHHLVDALIKSVERHTGQSSDETPQLATVMEGLFSYMIENGKEIGELLAVVETLISHAGTHKDGSLRVPADFFKALEKSDNPTARQGAWSLKFLLKFPPRDFINSIHSLANRLRLFNNPINHNLLDTPETTLHLEREIDSVDGNGRRPFLLFNIPADDSKARMAATFLLTKIDKIIRGRDAARKKLPFFVYIDEFYEFVDKELAKNFARVRQFGLGYIVAHQNMAQLKENDPEGIIADTIFDNTSVQLVMAVKHQAAEYVAKNCFRVTGAMEKKSFTTSEGVNEATGYSLSRMTGGSKSRSTTESESEGEKWSKSFSKTSGRSLSKAIGRSSSSGGGSGRSSGSSESRNQSSQTPVHGSCSLDGRRTTGSVIGSSSQETTNTSYSEGTQETETAAENSSETEGRDEGGSRTTGRSEQQGINENFAETYGRSLSLGNSSSESVQTEFLGVDEERQLLAQEIQALAPRELFVCFPRLTAYKAATFDSLIIQLSEQGYLGHLEGDDFYPSLLKAQADEREKMKKLLENGKSKENGYMKMLEDLKSRKKENDESAEKNGGKDYKGKMF